MVTEAHAMHSLECTVPFTMQSQFSSLYKLINLDSIIDGNATWTELKTGGGGLYLAHMIKKDRRSLEPNSGMTTHLLLSPLRYCHVGFIPFL